MDPDDRTARRVPRHPVAWLRRSPAAARLPELRDFAAATACPLEWDEGRLDRWLRDGGRAELREQMREAIFGWLDEGGLDGARAEVAREEAREDRISLHLEAMFLRGWVRAGRPRPADLPDRASRGLALELGLGPAGRGNPVAGESAEREWYGGLRDREAESAACLLLTEPLLPEALCDMGLLPGDEGRDVMGFAEVALRGAEPFACRLALGSHLLGSCSPAGIFGGTSRRGLVRDLGPLEGCAALAAAGEAAAALAEPGLPEARRAAASAAGALESMGLRGSPGARYHAARVRAAIGERAASDALLAAGAARGDPDCCGEIACRMALAGEPADRWLSMALRAREAGLPTGLCAHGLALARSRGDRPEVRAALVGALALGERRSMEAAWIAGLDPGALASGNAAEAGWAEALDCVARSGRLDGYLALAASAAESCSLGWLVDAFSA